MSHLVTPNDLVLRTSVGLHERVRAAAVRLEHRAAARLGRDGTDRGASHATEVAGAVVLVGAIWVAIQALGLDATLSTGIQTAVQQAIGG